MSTIEQYRLSEPEKARSADLLRLLPRGRHSVLDIGARDGYFSQLLTRYFEQVTALDLQQPAFKYDRVTSVAGDVTRLQFEDNSFDCVFCTEVLEHILELELACYEIARVARYEVIVGVPYKQDTRVSRTTCRRCGRPNPPWGHINQFDEDRLTRLFSSLLPSAKSFVWSNNDCTNPVSVLLMDWAGNPWGSYDQDEPCIHCGAQLTAPSRVTLASRLMAGVAIRLNRLESAFFKPHANWIHMVFRKNGRGHLRSLPPTGGA